MNELDYVKSVFDKYISECENLSKEPPNGWTASAANKSKIKLMVVAVVYAWRTLFGGNG